MVGAVADAPHACTRVHRTSGRSAPNRLILRTVLSHPQPQLSRTEITALHQLGAHAGVASWALGGCVACGIEAPGTARTADGISLGHATCVLRHHACEGREEEVAGERRIVSRWRRGIAQSKYLYGSSGSIGGAAGEPSLRPPLAAVCWECACMGSPAVSAVAARTAMAGHAGAWSLHQRLLLSACSRRAWVAGHDPSLTVCMHIMARGLYPSRHSCSVVWLVEVGLAAGDLFTADCLHELGVRTLAVEAVAQRSSLRCVSCTEATSICVLCRARRLDIAAQHRFGMWRSQTRNWPSKLAVSQSESGAAIQSRLQWRRCM